MATGTSAGELAGRYRRLAALVEQLEADGYDVVDAEPTEDEHGRQHAAVQLNLDGGIGIEPFHADELESDEAEENHATASITSTCNGGENDGDDQDDEFEVGDEIDEQDSDAEEEDEQEPGDADEGDEGVDIDSLQEEMEQRDESGPDTPAERVLATLREEGELAGTEIKTLAEVGNVYNVIRSLEDDDLIAKRADPDDGRRTLCRPAEMDVDEKDDQAEDDDAPDAADGPDVWCGICGKGPFERFAQHASMVHDGDEIPLDHEPTEAELLESDEEDEEDQQEEDDDDLVPTTDIPDYEGPNPEVVVAESSLPPHLALDDVLDAAVDATRADAPVISVVTDELGVRSDVIEPVLRELDLQHPDRRMLVDDVGARVAAIREEVDDE